MTVLYEQDYVAWLDATLHQLQQQDIDRLDWEHLTDEGENYDNNFLRYLT